jgi:hypothetical protein
MNVDYTKMGVGWAPARNLIVGECPACKRLGCRREMSKSIQVIHQHRIERTEKGNNRAVPVDRCVWQIYTRHITKGPQSGSYLSEDETDVVKAEEWDRDKTRRKQA